MQSIRFDGRDRLLIAVCAVIFIVSLFIGFRWFGDVMPEASIDFQVDRAQSNEIAGDYLKSLGISLPDSFRHAAIFSWDNQAKTYLEKELGLEQAQQYFGDPVRLWSWRNRWFSPGVKEEYRVWVSPEGDVISMNHLEDEDAAGAFLERDDAYALAFHFLTQSLGVDSARVTLNEGSQQNRPNRSDWTFVWRINGFEPLPGSEYRHEVVLHGDQIAGFSEYLHVPETWSSDYRRLRSYNQLAGGVASLLLLVTMIAVVIVFIQKLRAKEIQWKTALIFGTVAAALVYANNLNGLPNTLYNYDTTTSWSGFLLQSLFLGLLTSLAIGLFIALLTAGAEAIYRERHPELPSLPRLFTPRGLRTKRAFINIVVGITMTAFFFAYQTLFYMAADALGGWSPADVPYDNLLNTMMPWLAVLMIGFMPAVSEEFMSRLFSIPLLEKLFKGKALWLAIVIPAFIWGFGHAGYPNQPFWIRGVEVGIAGVIIGTLFLRFGILAPLLWHYTVDAFYTGFLLMGSDNIYFVITAAVGASLVVVPLVAALIAYLRTGTFLPEAGTRNADIVGETIEPPAEGEAIQPPEAEAEMAVESPAEPESAPKPTGEEETEAASPLPLALKIAAPILLILGVLLVPSTQLGDFIKFDTTRQQAIEAFSDTLASLGWADTDTLELTASIGGGGGSASGPEAYTLKHVASLEEFNARFDTLHGVGRWTVMAWKPLDRFRFLGLVDGGTGRVVRLRAMLPEEMAGDSLSEDSARALAESSLATFGVEVDSLALAESSSSAHPSRLDHTLVYETREGDPRNLGDAKLRWTVSVDGDYVSLGAYPRLKVPESWQRDRQASTGLRTARRVLIILLRAAAFGYLLLLLLSQSRAGAVNWKRSLLWSLAPLLLFLLSLPGQFANLKSAYFWNTEIPWAVFLGSGAISLVVTSAAMYLLFMLTFAIASAIWEPKVAQLNRPAKYNAPFDTLIAAIGGLGLYVLAGSLVGTLDAALPNSLTFEGWDVSSSLGISLPLLPMISSTVVRAATTALSLMVLAVLWQRLFKTPLLRALMVVLILIAGQKVGAVGGGEWLHSLLETVIRFGLAGAVLALFVRGSAVRLVAIAWLAGLAPLLAQAWELVPSLHAQTVIAAVIGLALLGYWVSVGRRRQSV